MDLKRRIKESGLSIKDVAERMPDRKGKIGITQASMSSIISGNPTVNTLRDLAGVLNISVSELVKEDNEDSIEAIIKDGSQCFTPKTKMELLELAQRLCGSSNTVDWDAAYQYARNILVSGGKQTKGLDAINDFIRKYEENRNERQD